MNKEWIEVEIITDEENEEVIEAILYSTGVDGVSVQNSLDFEFLKQNSAVDEYYPEELNFIKDKAILRAYYKEDENLNGIITTIKERIEKLDELGFSTENTHVTSGKINEENWENNWKKYFKPTRIGDRTVVKPTWEEYSNYSNDIVVELDPGMAFGTGTHETTSLCVKALEKYIRHENRVYDIGTGSGILSIVASKLGAKDVVGVDLDPVAVNVAEENVELNKLSNVNILHGDLMEVVEGKADIIVANILAHIILLLSDNVLEFLEKDGLFISSGIINDKKDEVVSKLEALGFTILEILNDGEWNCIIAKN